VCVGWLNADVKPGLYLLHSGLRGRERDGDRRQSPAGHRGRLGLKPRLLPLEPALPLPGAHGRFREVDQPPAAAPARRPPRPASGDRQLAACRDKPLRLRCGLSRPAVAPCPPAQALPGLRSPRLSRSCPERRRLRLGEPASGRTVPARVPRADGGPRRPASCNALRRHRRPTPYRAGRPLSRRPSQRRGRLRSPLPAPSPARGDLLLLPPLLSRGGRGSYLTVAGTPAVSSTAEEVGVAAPAA